MESIGRQMVVHSLNCRRTWSYHEPCTCNMVVCHRCLKGAPACHCLLRYWTEEMADEEARVWEKWKDEDSPLPVSPFPVLGNEDREWAIRSGRASEERQAKVDRDEKGRF